MSATSCRRSDVQRRKFINKKSKNYGGNCAKRTWTCRCFKFVLCHASLFACFCKYCKPARRRQCRAWKASTEKQPSSLPTCSEKFRTNAASSILFKANCRTSTISTLRDYCWQCLVSTLAVVPNWRVCINFSLLCDANWLATFTWTSQSIIVLFASIRINFTESFLFVTKIQYKQRSDNKHLYV